MSMKKTEKMSHFYPVYDTQKKVEKINNIQNHLILVRTYITGVSITRRMIVFTLQAAQITKSFSTTWNAMPDELIMIKVYLASILTLILMK